MTDFDFTIWLLTLLGFLAGCVGIWWARSSTGPLRMLCGRCLFVAALLGLGITAAAAAIEHAMSLAPMGLVSVFLVVGMFWENPTREWSAEQRS